MNNKGNPTAGEIADMSIGEISKLMMERIAKDKANGTTATA